MTEISRGLASVTCCTELHGVTCQQTAIYCHDGWHLSLAVPKCVESHLSRLVCSQEGQRLSFAVPNYTESVTCQQTAVCVSLKSDVQQYCLNTHKGGVVMQNIIVCAF